MYGLLRGLHGAENFQRLFSGSSWWDTGQHSVMVSVCPCAPDSLLCRYAHGNKACMHTLRRDAIAIWQLDWL